MTAIAFIVEGGQDASFLGQLLKRRGLSQVKTLQEVPDEWQPLFPRVFPADGINLDRVMRFPEIFSSGGLSVGIVSAGSDSRLISTLRIVIDAMERSTLNKVAIFTDCDSHQLSKRVEKLRKGLFALNQAAQQEGQPGYPLTVPSVAGQIEGSAPAIGIYVFPDNAGNGSLEDILISCAEINHREVVSHTCDMVDRIDESIPEGYTGLSRLRSGNGKKKAIVGTIASVLKPGASTSSSLAQTDWLSDSIYESENVVSVDRFLSEMLDRLV